jgi:hypothetical protein
MCAKCLIILVVELHQAKQKQKCVERLNVFNTTLLAGHVGQMSEIS